MNLLTKLYAIRFGIFLIRWLRFRGVKRLQLHSIISFRLIILFHWHRLYFRFWFEINCFSLQFKFSGFFCFFVSVGDMCVWFFFPFFSPSQVSNTQYSINFIANTLYLLSYKHNRYLNCLIMIWYVVIRIDVDAVIICLTTSIWMLALLHVDCVWTWRFSLIDKNSAK